MKLEISQTTFRVIARLAEDDDCFVVIRKTFDLATNKVYSSEINCVVLRQQMTIEQLTNFIHICEIALSIAKWMNTHIKTIDDFKNINLPSSIQDYK